jgi:hypothetical protein
VHGNHACAGLLRSVDRTHLCCNAATERAMSSIPDEFVLYGMAVIITVLVALPWITL